jgi:hypothetical protein
MKTDAPIALNEFREIVVVTSIHSSLLKALRVMEHPK